MNGFAPVAAGRQSWQGHCTVARHGHEHAYAAIVLSGSYEECGSRGRFFAGAGDVLLHGAFDNHLDRFSPRGAQLLNLAMPGFEAPYGMGCLKDPDGLARTADRDPGEARARLVAELREADPPPQDWPDLLARDLTRNPDCPLQAWARAHGLAAETLSRGFAKVFGITPAAFRLEARTRRALTLIASGDSPLAAVAAACGFADQAHLSRSLRTFTGRTPGDWRRSNRFKTEGFSAA